MKPRLLVVDDDQGTCLLLEAQIEALGYDVETEGSAEELRNALQRYPFSAILMDIGLPDGDGIELLQEVKQSHPAIPVIMITADGSIERAVESIRHGAYDFISKPIDNARLEVAVQRAIERYTLEQKVDQFERTHRKGLCDMVGRSPSMQVVYHIIETVAKTNASVMITGESGTGKELVARAIHQLSPRSSLHMIELNCAAIPKDLLESELFGHERHAFTGANKRQEGRCEQADKSTLFLDEIAEMDMNLQPKLLRFLQEHSFYRIGGKNKITVDTRIISATNRNPLDAIRENHLREDLYYRLNVVNISLPPLRDRGVDILDIAKVFLTRYSNEHVKQFESISESCKERLLEHNWPGNIRELQNCIQQSVVLHSGNVLEPEMLPPTVWKKQATVPVPQIESAPDSVEEKPAESESSSEKTTTKIVPLIELEKEAIDNALQVTRGNVAIAAGALQISTATLYRKIREYNLNVKAYKEIVLE